MKGKVITIAGERFAVRARGMRKKPFALEGSAGWLFVGERELLVDFSVPFLASTMLVAAVAYAAKLARALVDDAAAELSGEVRELDLCVDLAWAVFCEVDRVAFVGRLRTLIAWERHSTRTRGGASLTGLRIGNRNALSITLYDKTAELTARHGATSPRAVDERSRWVANGWNSEGSVWRAEVRFRGKVLTEYGLRDPMTLTERIDPAWQAVTRKTLRLVELGSAPRRERCKIDPRWAALQGATFTRCNVAPADRARRPGRGAAMRQAVGTMVSALAGSRVPRHKAERALGAMLVDVGATDEIATLGTRCDVAWARLGGVE
jgi:hypothetical protein